MHLGGSNQQFGIHINFSQTWKVGRITPRVLVDGHCLMFT